jgi:hypothetical protein
MRGVWLALADEMAAAAVAGDAPSLELEAALCRLVALAELADPLAQGALWEVERLAREQGRGTVARAGWVQVSRQGRQGILPR